MSKLNQEELLEELKQMEVDEEETHKGSLEVPGVNAKLMNQIHQKRKQAYQQIKEMLRDYNLIKDTCKMLVLKLEEKPGVTEKWLLDFLREMPIYDAQPRKDYAFRKFKEAGIKVRKK